MSKGMLQGFALICGLALVSGCVSARTYAVDKERVDQEMSGNSGYLEGNADDRGDYKKTRRTYVLELQDKKQYEEGRVSEQPSRYVDESRSQRRQSSSAARRVELPVIEDVDRGVQEYEDYEVQKNDTLQKISKKFYGGYSKWPKIFEANKALLGDPNRIKPGMVLKIPVE